MYFASADEMARLDDLAVRKGLKIRQMMELAGWHMVKVFSEMKVDSHSSVVICVGKGNKGGDGAAAARHLANYGYRVSIIKATSEVSSDSQHHLKMAQQMDIPVFEWDGSAQDMLDESDVIVDALIGYRLKGDPSGPIGEVADHICQLEGKTVIAYDVPTGLDASTGQCFHPCIAADATLTLALPKKAQDSAGKQHYGRTFIGDIGMPAFLYDQIAPKSRPDFQNGLLEVI